MNRCYTPPKKADWFGRSDAQDDAYLFQQIQLLNLDEDLASQAITPGFALLGFASDEGVKRNLGRVGAQEGPDKLKQSLGQLPLQKKIALYDAGNIVCAGEDLEAAQKALGDKVAWLLANQLQPILLGGGHETAWGHYQGIAQHLGQEDIAIVNLDAHFDLRSPVQNTFGTSGTSFKQIADARKAQGLDFHYYCFGIQTTANTKALFETADALNTHYIFANDMHESMANAQQLVNNIIKKHKHIYLTICLDVFASHLAPGVSAPQVNGITLQQALQIIQPLLQSKKIISSDIVEYAPCFDIDRRTAKLACTLIDQML